MLYKGKNTIGVDIIILEYRGEPLTLTNIFALVEIKFQGDRIEKAQFDNYKDLKDQCAQAKKASKITASEGFKLSLFRYREDTSSKDQPNQQKQMKPKAGNKK